MTNDNNPNPNPNKRRPNIYRRRKKNNPTGDAQQHPEPRTPSERPSSAETPPPAKPANPASPSNGGSSGSPNYRGKPNRFGSRGRNNNRLQNNRSQGERTQGARTQGARTQGERSPLPSVPIQTNRGIKARSQRGAFSKNWWARRWIEAMEELAESPRLQRGRTYARSGQVLSIVETPRGIQSSVQGSRPQPYLVNIEVTPLEDEQWDLVIDALSEQALFTAQLLAGEMPEDIEEAFHKAGVSLFPEHAGDLFTKCSCPDWANPCKHVAATHYILGDRFDDDPFLLFRMRGRSQEQILAALRERRAGENLPEENLPAEAPPEVIPPLSDDIARFWEPLESLDTFPLTIKPASTAMPLLQRLGEPAFLTKDSLQSLLKTTYETFMISALRAAYSDEEPVEESNGHDDPLDG